MGLAGTSTASDRGRSAALGRGGAARSRLRERGPGGGGARNLECVDRVARARARAPVSGPAIRRGAVPRQVLEPPRPLRRRRAGRDRREPRAAGAPDGFLHGWRRVGPRGRPPRSSVLGLAPWLPDELDLAPLRGRRLDVLHGALDRWLPGIPGVSPALSRRGYERARALGVDGSYTLIPRAVHAVALRSPSGRLVPLPRAASWSELAAARIFDFRRSAERVPQGGGGGI